MSKKILLGPTNLGLGLYNSVTLLVKLDLKLIHTEQMDLSDFIWQ